MRIAHVISSPSGIGGAERVMLELTSEGARQGWNQVVLHPFAAPGEESLARLCPPMTYRPRSCAHWRELPALRSWLASQLADFAPEIVHVHLFHALALVASVPRPTRAKLLLTHHHGSRYVDERQRTREAIDRVCGRRFDAVVGVSDATRRLLVGRYRYRAEKVHTIVNGWSGSPIPKHGSSTGTVICVANFRAQKGHDVLLDAFSSVARKVPESQLLLVGDGPLRPELEQQAIRLGIRRQVDFKGHVADVWPLLAESDVFALASHYEPLGLAALEAMAAGLPVVATRVGGLGELIEPGVTGVLVEPNDPHALAGALSGLLTSEVERFRMGSAAEARAATRRADAMVESYLGLYRELTSELRTDRNVRGGRRFWPS